MEGMRMSPIITIVLLAGLLTACGSSDKKVAPVGRTVTITATTTVTPSAQPQPSPTPQGIERGFYTVRAVKVRAQPDDGATVVDTLPDGTKVTGYVQGDWLQLTGGEPGYLPMSALEDPTPGAGKTSATAQAERGFYTTRAVAVRSSPSSSADVVSTLPDGTKVTGFVQGDWLKVTGGDPGYLPMSALEDPTPG